MPESWKIDGGVISEDDGDGDAEEPSVKQE
jgi:hypothetical protein